MFTWATIREVTKFVAKIGSKSHQKVIQSTFDCDNWWEQTTPIFERRKVQFACNLNVHFQWQNDGATIAAVVEGKVPTTCTTPETRNSHLHFRFHRLIVKTHWFSEPRSFLSLNQNFPNWHIWKWTFETQWCSEQLNIFIVQQKFPNCSFTPTREDTDT